MSTPARLPRLLVLRPYLGQATRDGAYAHVDALVMYTRDGTMPCRYGELRPLISDLPAGQREQTPVLSPAAAPGSGPRSKNVVAIMSGASRQGTWRVGGTINAVAVCGGVELDLTEAVFDQQHVHSGHPRRAFAARPSSVTKDDKGVRPPGFVARGRTTRPRARAA